MERSGRSPRFDRLREDRAFAFIADAYRDEFPVRLHDRDRGSAGGFSGVFRRVLYDKNLLRLKQLDPDGSEAYYTAAWVLPVREAVKRLRGGGELLVRGSRRTVRFSQEYRWLRAVLAWRGLPCFCNHPSIVEHLAYAEEVEPDVVVRKVLAAARRCVATLERVGALPGLPSTPPQWKAKPTAVVRDGGGRRVFDP